MIKWNMEKYWNIIGKFIKQQTNRIKDDQHDPLRSKPNKHRRPYNIILLLNIRMEKFNWKNLLILNTFQH